MAKTDGSIVLYAEERLDALMNEYHSYIDSCAHIRMSEVFDAIVLRPCPRFWVSVVRAKYVVGRMMRGDVEFVSRMRPSKREMFCEIHSRVLALKCLRPEAKLHALIEEVVESPAPKFYLSPGSAKIMVCKAKKLWYQRRKQRRLL